MAERKSVPSLTNTSFIVSSLVSVVTARSKATNDSDSVIPGWCVSIRPGITRFGFDASHRRNYDLIQSSATGAANFVRRYSGYHLVK